MAGIPDKDHALFEKAVDGARKLTQDRVAPFRPPIRPVPRHTEHGQDRVIAEMLTFVSEDIDVGTGEELLYFRDGVSKNWLRQVRRGRFAIERELDLHGLTVEQARAALGLFLHEAMRDQRRCVRIIHGKGLRSTARLPVLKGCVNSWLRQRNEVLAFCSARPEDGGTGAVYVLLKRMR
ncbi:MAG: Smr/MutS family protein [Gammaproteobacteria bacterium]|nr:Smr/MutS family protein [Gammaproteobacteria bacterium]